MPLTSRSYATLAVVAFFVLAPLAAQAGQLFPPADLAAAGTPNVSCPNGKVLTWGKLASAPTDPVIICADPTPGVTVTCPAEQVLTGITNGQAVCAASNSSTSCPANQVMVGIAKGVPVCKVVSTANGYVPYPTTITCPVVYSEGPQQGQPYGHAYTLDFQGLANNTYTYQVGVRGPGMNPNLPDVTYSAVYDANTGALLRKQVGHQSRVAIAVPIDTLKPARCHPSRSRPAPAS